MHFRSTSGSWDASFSVVQKLEDVLVIQILAQTITHPPLEVKRCPVKLSLLESGALGNLCNALGIISVIIKMRLMDYILFPLNRLVPYCSFNFRESSHGLSSTSISQVYLGSSTSIPHQNQQYEEDRKRRKSAHSNSTSSLHRRNNNGNGFSADHGRHCGETIQDHIYNPNRGRFSTRFLIFPFGSILFSALLRILDIFRLFMFFIKLQRCRWRP